jgi:RNA polymerase sigma factor (TIGR02999 family)
MSDVTQILNAIQNGNPQAVDQLFPLVYDELRKLASQKMAQEKPGQTLNPTGLVHEAYLRLIGEQQFDNRRHFFAAAAEAMRRILIDRVRTRQALKRGGKNQQKEIDLNQIESRYSDNELIEIHTLLDDLVKIDPEAGELVRLHVFGGFSLEESGTFLGMSRATAYRNWTFARAWLRDALSASE